MSIHLSIREALVSSVEAHDQPEVLAARLTAWVEAIAEGNSTLDQKDDVARHLEECLEHIDVPAGEIMDFDFRKKD